MSSSGKFFFGLAGEDSVNMADDEKVTCYLTNLFARWHWDSDLFSPFLDALLDEDNADASAMRRTLHHLAATGINRSEESTLEIDLLTFYKEKYPDGKPLRTDTGGSDEVMQGLVGDLHELKLGQSAHSEGSGSSAVSKAAVYIDDENLTVPELLAGNFQDLKTMVDASMNDMRQTMARTLAEHEEHITRMATEQSLAACNEQLNITSATLFRQMEEVKASLMKTVDSHCALSMKTVKEALTKVAEKLDDLKTHDKKIEEEVKILRERFINIEKPVLEFERKTHKYPEFSMANVTVREEHHTESLMPSEKKESQVYEGQPKLEPSELAEACSQISSIFEDKPSTSEEKKHAAPERSSEEAEKAIQARLAKFREKMRRESAAAKKNEKDSRKHN